MTDKPKKKFPWLKILIGCIIFYLVIGFIVLPLVIKHVLHNQVAEQIKHEIQVEQVKLNPLTLTLQISNFKILDETPEPLVSFSHILGNFQIASLFQDAWTFKEFRLEKPFAKVILKKDGSINLQELQPDPDPNKIQDTQPTSKKKPKALVINSCIIDQGIFNFHDHTQPEPFEHTIQPINLSIDNVSTRLNDTSLLTLFIQTEQDESIDINSQLNLNPLSVNTRIEISNLKLSTFSSYVSSSIPLELSDGTLSVSGTLTYSSDSTDSPSAMFNGTTAISNFSLVSLANKDPFLGFQQLTINTPNLSLMDQNYAVESILLDGLELNTGLDSNGEVAILASNSTESNPPAETSSEVVVDEDKAPNPQINISSIKLTNGEVNVYDESIAPTFNLSLGQLNSEFKNISTQPDTVVDMTFESQLDQSGAINFSGTVKPFANQKDLDIVVKLANYEIIALTPYTGKFIGYALEKGKLNFDIDYQIEENQLIGQHDILVDQLNLGEKVDSKDAVKAPIKLGVSLLQDRKGQIKINLPVKGDLSDPEFKFTHLIGKSLLNLFTKVVSSPFSLLADMAGLDGESFNYVAFKPGLDALTVAEEEKLLKMAEVLVDRPKLNVTIHPTSNTDKDLFALKEQLLLQENPELTTETDTKRLNKMLKKLYRKNIGSKEFSTLEDSFKNKGTENWETDLYKKVRQDVINVVNVDPGQLKILADQRAKNIQNFFLEKAQVNSSRIFIGKEESEKESDKDIIKNKLSLSAQ